MGELGNQKAASEGGEFTIGLIPDRTFRNLATAEIPSLERVAIWADLCRINALGAIAAAGSGHVGSSFSAMDIVTWLHLEVLEESDIYFSSKGHDVPGFYAVLASMGKFPVKDLLGLRQLLGLPGHPDVSVPGVSFNTGSLGMGISKAKGWVRGARLRGERRRCFVLTGDGELQEGQIWESLQGASSDKMGEITVVVDHNKIQSDTWVDEVSSLGDLEAKFAAFGWHVQRVDGHDFDGLSRAFAERQRYPETPGVIIADTIKGKGVSFMMKTEREGRFDFYKYHSGAPGGDAYAKAVDELQSAITVSLGHQVELDLSTIKRSSALNDQRRLIPAYSSALLELARRNRELLALDADLMLDSGLIPFAEEFPDRFIECGIAEMDMVSQAGGLAAQGYLPICHSFSCFMISRANEQIYNNATELRKVIYVGGLAGLIPATPGHSHQSLRDIGLFSGIPGALVAEPSCPEEVEGLLEILLSNPSPACYLRLCSVPVSIPYQLPEGYQPEIGRGVALRKGTDAAIVTYGPILLSEAFRAAVQLEEQGLRISVINLPWLNRVDSAWFRETLGEIPLVLAIDNHHPDCGQTIMLRAMAQGYPIRFLSRGVSAIPACGQSGHVLAHHGLDAASIAQLLSRELNPRP